MKEISTAAPIGHAGLGVMDTSMARKLIKAGFQVALHEGGGAGRDSAATGLLYHAMPGINRRSGEA